MWTLDDSRALARRLEDYLKTRGWHVALGGSVLHAGESAKDLDLFVYPHDTTAMRSEIDVGDALRLAGFRRVSDVRATREVWRAAGSRDRKRVEVWRDADRRRVDVFYVS